MTTTNPVTNRLRTMTPAERTEFLRGYNVASLTDLAEKLGLVIKPKTPRPVVEKRVLAALAEQDESNARAEAFAGHELPRDATGDAHNVPAPESEAKPLDEALADSPVGAANAATWDGATPTGDDEANDDEDEDDDDSDSDDQDADATSANDAPDGAPAEAAAATALPSPTGANPGDLCGTDGAPAAPAREPAAAPTARTPRPIDPRLPPVGTVIKKLDRHGAVRCECTVLEGGKIEYRGKVYSSMSAAGHAAQVDLGIAGKTCDGWAFWGAKTVARASATKKDAVASLETAWERYRARAATIAKAASAEERAKVNEALHQHAKALLALAGDVAA